MNNSYKFIDNDNVERNVDINVDNILEAGTVALDAVDADELDYLITQYNDDGLSSMKTDQITDLLHSLELGPRDVTIDSTVLTGDNKLQVIGEVEFAKPLYHPIGSDFSRSNLVEGLGTYKTGNNLDVLSVNRSDVASDNLMTKFVTNFSVNRGSFRLDGVNEFSLTMTQVFIAQSIYHISSSDLSSTWESDLVLPAYGYGSIKDVFAPVNYNQFAPLVLRDFASQYNFSYRMGSTSNLFICFDKDLIPYSAVTALNVEQRIQKTGTFIFNGYLITLTSGFKSDDGHVVSMSERYEDLIKMGLVYQEDDANGPGTTYYYGLSNGCVVHKISPDVTFQNLEYDIPSRSILNSQFTIDVPSLSIDYYVKAYQPKFLG